MQPNLHPKYTQSHTHTHTHSLSLSYTQNETIPLSFSLPSPPLSSLSSFFKWLCKAMSAMASETYSAVSAPVQYAAVEAYSGAADIEEYLLHQRRVLRSVGDYCVRTLHAAGLEALPARGGFYLFLRVADPDLRQLVCTKHGQEAAASGAGLCASLMRDSGVAVLPGEAFMRPRAELSARYAFVDFDGEHALSESARVGLSQPLPADFAPQVAPRTTASAHAIAKFLS
jgi:aspartate aminotransferase